MFIQVRCQKRNNQKLIRALLLMKTTMRSDTSDRVINIAASEFLSDSRFLRRIAYSVRVQTGCETIANRLTYHRRPSPLTNCLQLFSRSNCN